MKKKKQKKFLLILILILILMFYYDYYGDKIMQIINRKDTFEKNESDRQEEKEETKQEPIEENSKKVNSISKNGYQTKDGKYRLIIVNEDEKAKAQEEFNKLNKRSVDNAIGYAYLNDQIMVLSSIEEDELYATYIGIFPNAEGASKEYFLVDVKNKIIMEKDAFHPEKYTNNMGEAYNRFNGEERGYIHKKNRVGYFFQKVSDKEGLLYTTDWKELGYLESVEDSGVNVCNDYVFCTIITKYDAKGNKLEINKNNDFLYKSKDGKYTLRIIHQSEINEEDQSMDISKYHLFAYFNNQVILGITSYSIDSKYTLYKGVYLKRNNQDEQYYLVDNDTKVLITNPFFVKDELMDDEGFYLFNAKYSPINFLKTSIGYFFIFEDKVKTIYTTKWEKIGYAKEIVIEDKAIVLYDNDELKGSPKKYNNSGKIVN